MLAFLLSHKEDWEVRVDQLVKQGQEGKKVIRRVFQELREFGYAKLVPVKEIKGGVWTGRWLGKQYLIHESPVVFRRPNPPKSEPSEMGGVIVPIRKTMSPSRRGDGDRKSGFFSDGEEINPFVKKATNVLIKYLSTTFKINHAIKLSSWWHDFTLLLDSIDGDKKRLKSVLLGYTDKEVREFKPQAWSARSFRKKFLQIEAWVNKYNPPPPKEEYIYEVEEGRTYK